MLKHSATILTTLLVTFCNLFAQEPLPLGSHPPAISFEHFPTRMYAVVWRNWNLVEPSRIALTIGCDVEDVLEVAASMGLPAAQPIPPAFKKQISITVASL